MLGFARGRRRTADDLVDDMPGAVKIPLEPILTRLMMSMRVVISDFEYNTDRHGRPYGWGVARYTTPESLYGRLDAGCTPQESHDKMVQHLHRMLPYAQESKILKLIG